MSIAIPEVKRMALAAPVEPAPEPELGMSSSSPALVSLTSPESVLGGVPMTRVASIGATDVDTTSMVVVASAAGEATSAGASEGWTKLG